MDAPSPIRPETHLEALREADLLRRVRTASGPGPRLVVEGREVIAFASNDYLGLAGDERLVEALAKGARAEGAGAGAARLLTGARPAHEALELATAAFKGAEAALLFGSGFTANVSVIPALTERGDRVVSDERNHASLIDGCRLSRAEVVVVPHGDVDAFDRALAVSVEGKRFLLTEGLFSMDGDTAPLRALAEVAARRGALLVVDDAHGCGVLGDGSGAVRAAGLAPGPGLLELGTYGKAFGGYGAFAAWTRDGIDLLVQRARGFVFSTALPPGIAAMNREALRIAADEPQRRTAVLDLAAGLRRRLGDLAGRRSDTGPIVPVVVGDPAAALRLSTALLERGLWVPAVRPPTVPAGTSRLRISLSAAHRREDVDALADAVIAERAA